MIKLTEQLSYLSEDVDVFVKEHDGLGYIYFMKKDIEIYKEESAIFIIKECLKIGIDLNSVTSTIFEEIIINKIKELSNGLHG